MIQFHSFFFFQLGRFNHQPTRIKLKAPFSLVKAIPPQQFQLFFSKFAAEDHFQEALTSSGSIFFWYDYFSVPQYEVNCPGFATNPNEEQAKAIASIPGFFQIYKFSVFFLCVFFG